MRNIYHLIPAVSWSFQVLSAKRCQKTTGSWVPAAVLRHCHCCLHLDDGIGQPWTARQWSSMPASAMCPSTLAFPLSTSTQRKDYLNIKPTAWSNRQLSWQKWKLTEMQHCAHLGKRHRRLSTSVLGADRVLAQTASTCWSNTGKIQSWQFL